MYKLRCNRPKTGKACVFVEVTYHHYLWGDECAALSNLNLDTRYIIVFVPCT